MTGSPGRSGRRDWPGHVVFAVAALVTLFGLGMFVAADMYLPGGLAMLAGLAVIVALEARGRR